MFFQSRPIEGKGRHWVSWNKMCLPEEERGLGFRLMQYVSNALFCKLWQNFRTKKSIWGSFMMNKYCKKLHPNKVVWKPGGGSQVCKKMLQVRDLIDHLINWKLREGNVHIWFDDWTGLGQLYSIIQDSRIG